MSRAIEILFEKLEKAVATGDTKTVTGIVEKFLIELNELVKTLPVQSETGCIHYYRNFNNSKAIEDWKWIT